MRVALLVFLLAIGTTAYAQTYGQDSGYSGAQRPAGGPVEAQDAGGAWVQACCGCWCWRGAHGAGRWKGRGHEQEKQGETVRAPPPSRQSGPQSWLLL